jgi:hypothetical protein
VVKFVAIMILLAIVLGLGALFYLGMYNSGLTDARILGSTVYVPDADAGTVYLLTGQWKTTFTTGRYVSNRVYTTDLLVDLWAIRAKDAKPLWRRRVQKENRGAMDARRVLGVDGDTVWLYLSGHLVAASRKTGDIVAAKGQVESLNPELKGVMPIEEQFYDFDSHGLRVTAADGRKWRIAGDTFEARPDEVYAEAGTAIPPAHFVAAYLSVFQAQSLEIPGWWLGLLTDEEATQFQERQWADGMESSERRRLWRAKETVEVTDFGTRTKYADYQVLPASPEFLAGGLFKEAIEGVNTEPMWFRDPDSVLVLHRERLDDTGTLRLTRVAGPEGSVVWDAALPLTLVQTATRGDDKLILFGIQYFGEKPGEHLDPNRDGLERLVIVDVATGAVHTHDHGDIEHHIEAVPADSGV